MRGQSRPPAGTAVLPTTAPPTQTTQRGWSPPPADAPTPSLHPRSAPSHALPPPPTPCAAPSALPPPPSLPPPPPPPPPWACRGAQVRRPSFMAVHPHRPRHPHHPSPQACIRSRPYTSACRWSVRRWLHQRPPRSLCERSERRPWKCCWRCCRRIRSWTWCVCSAVPRESENHPVHRKNVETNGQLVTKIHRRLQVSRVLSLVVTALAARFHAHPFGCRLQAVLVEQLTDAGLNEFLTDLDLSDAGDVFLAAQTRSVRAAAARVLAQVGALHRWWLVAKRREGDSASPLQDHCCTRPRAGGRPPPVVVGG
jgi:hypothetical protein